MKKIKLLILITFFMGFYTDLFSQAQPNNEIEYTNYDEALKDPEKVTRLKLSQDHLGSFPKGVNKFKNLQYLSLRNDHLKIIPEEIFDLKYLKILDLGGNDFDTLPDSFSKLQNLEELYLDNEANLNLDANLKVISELPRLKTLHLENDKITKLPESFFKLKTVENLYLSDNFLKIIPQEINGLKSLKYLDLKNNPIKRNNLLDNTNHPAFKIAF
jgi:Leucine-rich repeat (LRR) protein